MMAIGQGLTAALFAGISVYLLLGGQAISEKPAKI